jgi:hypothetical protein
MSTEHVNQRKHLGRYAAAGLIAAAIPLVGLSASANAAPTTSATGVPVAPIIGLAPDWSGSGGFGSGAPSWFKDTGFVDPDVVHLQGAVKQVSRAGPDPNLVATLPPAASPDRTVYTVVHTFDGTYADLAIQPNGQIDVIGARAPAVQDLSFLSLEGISYEQFIPAPEPFGTINTANWSPNAGFGSSVPAWYIDGSDVVHLQGAVTQTSAAGPNAKVIGTLSAAAMPNHDVYTVVHTFDGTYADLAISAGTGQISIIDPRSPAVTDLRFVSLEGISFPQAGAFQSLPVNTTNWTINAGFGSTRPAWELDAFGVMHLSGAVAQTSASGPRANVIGTLPSAARPHRTVYTIVHTFAGTYADLAIQPTGQIDVIGPRPPAVSDLRFLSLEGINYQP